MLLHVSPEKGIDAGLVAWSLPPVPFDDVAIDPQGELLLPLHRLQTPPHNGASEHLGRQFRDLGEIDVLVPQGRDALPVSRRFP